MNTYYTRSVQAFENLMQPTRLVVGRSRRRNYMSSPSRSPVGPAQYIPLLLSPHFESPQTVLGSAMTCSLYPRFCNRSKPHLAGTGRGQRAERQPVGPARVPPHPVWDGAVGLHTVRDFRRLQQKSW